MSEYSPYVEPYYEQPQQYYDPQQQQQNYAYPQQQQQEYAYPQQQQQAYEPPQKKWYSCSSYGFPAKRICIYVYLGVMITIFSLIVIALASYYCNDSSPSGLGAVICFLYKILAFIGGGFMWLIGKL